MKKLDRTLATTPVCLSKFSYLTQDWDSVKTRQKAKIWIELDKFQEKFCVYCESKAERGKGTGHIEHFFHKGNVAYKPLTFSWDNLFGCCDSRGHCGHFKDEILPKGQKKAYDPNKLIKPDVDDPEKFLQFFISGKVEAKKNLDVVDKEKAQLTISALNLDCSELNLSREAQLKRYNARLLVLTSVELSQVVLDEFDKLYHEAMNVAHRTALKQAIPW
ncbi:MULTISPECIES: retron Ec78 anti-phage system effector HNH endonuclease PtuB [Pantoea]|uniref:retron Ec78 anti-phage system effector HNH endonuclease PtuB n=1 Tax=Pantoea TaxID=53335 RepID=UPI001B31823B|nr:retron Ec78 anti-phage system effector HNH endonuclease PtuB [Pantoea ananatis]